MEAMAKTPELPDDPWSSKMWGHDVPTASESSHMPATAATAYHDQGSDNSELNKYATPPRIYVSPRLELVGNGHITTPGPPSYAKMDIVNHAYRTLTSKTAQRTALNTVLLTSVASFLYALAALAYILFYNAYLPDQVTVLPIHLQYGYGPNPYGVTPVSNLKDYQAYDISVSLVLPRTPSNVDRDNFMVALYLLDKPGTAVSPPPSADQTHNHHESVIPTILPPPVPHSHLTSRKVLHTSHRPALIPYPDPLLSLATRLLLLPLRLIFPSSLFSSSSTTTSLTLPLAERLSFPSGSLPDTIFLELQAGQSLRVASASLTLTAQLAGVRWLMHHYRVASFLAGTAAFWGCEVVFMGVAWGVLASVFSTSSSNKESQQKSLQGQGEKKRIQGGEGDISDTERTFPTTSRAPPLKYESSSGGIKEEKDLAQAISMAELPVAGAGEQADDEDDEIPEEEEGGWRDSGIGTSYSDAGGVGSAVRRRVSGKGR